MKTGIGSDFFDANYFKQNCNFGDEKELKDMENKGHTYSYLDRAISTLAWDNAALTELNNLVKDIENGKRIFKRFCKRGSYAFKSSGSRATKASIILRESSDASCTTQRLTKLRRRLRDEAVRPTQERIIETWSRAEGFWYDDVAKYVENHRILANHSSEAIVYFGGSYTLTKTISLTHFDNPQLAIDRIILHNMYFPDTAIKVEGFGRTDYGDFQIIVSQPFVIGIKPELDDIKKVIELYGFTQQRTPTTYKNDHYVISDLHQGNVLHVTDFYGNPLYMSNGLPLLAFIDTDMRFNTPDQGKDGKYVVDNGIVWKNKKIKNGQNSNKIQNYSF